MSFTGEHSLIKTFCSGADQNHLEHQYEFGQQNNGNVVLRCFIITLVEFASGKRSFWHSGRAVFTVSSPRSLRTVNESESGRFLTADNAFITYFHISVQKSWNSVLKYDLPTTVWRDIAYVYGRSKRFRTPMSILLPRSAFGRTKREIK